MAFPGNGFRRPARRPASLRFEIEWDDPAKPKKP
jgi:hypothetical protein